MDRGGRRPPFIKPLSSERVRGGEGGAAQGRGEDKEAKGGRIVVSGRERGRGNEGRIRREGRVQGGGNRTSREGNRGRHTEREVGIPIRGIGPMKKRKGKMKVHSR